MSTSIPSGDNLFATYYQPWYPPEYPDQPFLRTDIEEIELDPGVHIRVLSPLDDDAQERTRNFLTQLYTAAVQDFHNLLDLDGEPETNWLEQLDAHYTAERKATLFDLAEPDQFDNPVLILINQTGAIIANLLQQRIPRLQWLYDWPYWDSALFDLNTRIRLPVFHWAIRYLSSDTDHSLSEKIEATVDFLRDTK